MFYTKYVSRPIVQSCTVVYWLQGKCITWGQVHIGDNYDLGMDGAGPDTI